MSYLTAYVHARGLDYLTTKTILTLPGGPTAQDRIGGTMQHLPATRTLALIAGLLLAGTGSAVAQDTTDAGRAAMDTTAPTGAIDDTTAPTGAIDTSGADSAAARDTTDNSVTNPPGYRGMERDTTMFPDSAGPPATPGQVEDAATGTYHDSTWQDTTGAEQNPAGYRGMERVSGDSGSTADSTQ